MISIQEQCKGRWPNLLPMMGIDKKFLTGRQTPCPNCGGSDRFRWDNKENSGSFYCNNCGAGNGVDLVMLVTGKDFKETVSALRYKIGAAPIVKSKPVMTDQSRIESLRAMWRLSKPIQPDDDAGRYLASRNLQPTSALRFLPKCRITGEPEYKELAAMIALVCDPNGTPITLHRTYLLDGKKAPIAQPRRMFAGDTPIGSHIRLSEPSAVLGIGEGTETALAVKRDFGMDCWSAISDKGLLNFNPPEIVRELHIFCDNDYKFQGQAAGYGLATKLCLSKREISVKVHVPERGGSDYAD